MRNDYPYRRQAFYEDPESVSVEKIKEAIGVVQNTNPELLKYEAVDTVLSYPVKRVCRLNELTTIDIIKDYGIMLSRIGHPFDFVDDKGQGE